MAWAVCTVCQRETRWEARRGTRLRDLSCPYCGGQLRSSAAGGPRRRSPFAGLRTPKEYDRYPYRYYYREGLRWGYAGLAWVDEAGRLHVRFDRQPPYFSPSDTETAFREGVRAGVAAAARARQNTADPAGEE